MRIAVLACVAASIALLWLMERKWPGKICRRGSFAIAAALLRDQNF
jgi:hypothetical protein